MPRPISLSPLPLHPSIFVPAPPVIKHMYGHDVPIAIVTCPSCNQTREYPTSILRSIIRKGQRWTGLCRPCFNKTSVFPMQQRRRRNPAIRTVLKKGYVVLTRFAVDPADYPMFEEMQTNNVVFEHRWVMAKYLGRPLKSYELIDHQDGIKSHNEISNLRIYVKGKNQPGSSPGYGTYYHEWQMAEKRIRDLTSN